MEEKKLAESVRQKNKVATILLILGAILLVVGIVSAVITFNNGTEYYRGHTAYNPISGKNFTVEDKDVPYKEIYDSVFEFFPERMFANAYGYITILGIVALLAFVFISLKMNKSAVTVTNKRIIGFTDFGKQVDLPLSQVSSLGNVGSSGIQVSTSSGKTKFYLIQNRDEVYNAISKAMSDR